ncbi:MAG: TonB-dependent receptor [Bacteroidetes bacterium]|nr:TonB-dependent receptor [Bacteroidota bacterium]
MHDLLYPQRFIRDRLIKTLLVRFSGAFALILVLSFVAIAGTTGKITGRVTDAATKEPLIGATIRIEGTRLGAATDLDGYYVIINVPPGTYKLQASMVGYTESMVTNVSVSIDYTTKIDVELNQGTITQKEVTVVAQRPLIRKDLTSSSASVSAEQIQSMPVESFQDILQLQAGVVVGPSGDLHVRGGRSGEVSYMIDGVPVTDPYGWNASVQVGSEGIQELKLVSGTFNAEYGQAMSGVVDIVTKEGGTKLGGQITAYTGDYVSNHSSIFMNINHLNPLGVYSVQANLNGPVPLTSNNLRFFASVRSDYNQGWMFGKRVYNISDSSNFSSPDSTAWFIQKTGDGKIVPMNDSRQLNFQGKLSWQITGGIKVAYEGLYSGSDYHLYDHLFKYDPNGMYQYHTYGLTNILSFTHMLSSSTYYGLKLSSMHSDYAQYVFSNPFDPQYVDPTRLYTKGAFSFHTGGAAMGHFYHTTDVLLLKGDFTSQIDRYNLIKTGVELHRDRLWLHEYNIELDQQSNWQPVIPPITSYNNNEYLHYPIQAAVYLQDKIELKEIILNVGLRYDYFDSRGIVPVDPRDPSGTLKGNPNWFRQATPKYQLSPRIGMAFPITDRGVIHISYGHFFQVPAYQYLYADPGFEVIPGSLSTLMGNADLAPQETVQYEVGLQQQLADEVGLDVTGFYKDIRGLLGTEVFELYTLGDMYAKYVNLDYGNVRGITISSNIRLSNMLRASIDYTFQIAEGNASDPNSQFLNRQSSPPRADEVQVVPLNWDQRHTLNFVLSLGEPNDWSLGLIGRIESGLPYTPELQNLQVEFENNGRKPPQYTFDLEAQKVIKIAGLDYTMFLKIYNLFDQLNETGVYLDTGRAGYTLVSRYAGNVSGVNTLADFINRPDFYSAPRRVLFGVAVGF